MSIRVLIDLDTADYTGFSDTTPEPVPLTPRQAAVCLSLIVLANGRDAWEPMSDSAWDDWQAFIAGILDRLSIP